MLLKSPIEQIYRHFIQWIEILETCQTCSGSSCVFQIKQIIYNAIQCHSSVIKTIYFLLTYITVYWVFVIISGTSKIDKVTEKPFRCLVFLTVCVCVCVFTEDVRGQPLHRPRDRPRFRSPAPRCRWWSDMGGWTRPGCGLHHLHRHRYPALQKVSGAALLRTLKGYLLWKDCLLICFDIAVCVSESTQATVARVCTLWTAMQLYGQWNTLCMALPTQRALVCTVGSIHC